MFTETLRQLARRQRKGLAFGPLFIRARTFSGSRALARLPSLISVLLVIFLANQAANTLWIWFDFSAGQGMNAPAVMPMTGGAAKADFSVLSAYDPFHRAPRPVTDTAVQDAPVTSLDLELFGVRADENGKGSAIVRTPDKKQGVFRMGDALMTGVTLQAVMTDRIVISHRGSTESLYLNPDAKNRQTIAQAPAPSGQSVEVGKLDAHSLSIDTMLNAVRLSPHMVGGTMRGFSVNPGVDEQTFRRTGLQPGDVLLAINGTALDTADRMAVLETSLRGAQRIQLEIERAGARKTIEIVNAL